MNFLLVFDNLFYHHYNIKLINYQGNIFPKNNFKIVEKGSRLLYNEYVINMKHFDIIVHKDSHRPTHKRIIIVTVIIS